MRPACWILFLGVVFACSGEPFVGVSGRAVGNAGSGGASNFAGHGDVPVPFGAGGSAERPESVNSGGNSGGAKTTSDAALGGGGSTAGTSMSGGGTAPASAGNAPLGDGGAAGAVSAPECPARSGGDWALGFFPELRDAVTQESHPFFEIENLGAATSLNRIKIRYYFSKEVDEPETAACYWVTGDRCAFAQMHFGDVSGTTPAASRYLEVEFPGASDVVVMPGDFEVRVGFKIGSSPMIQTNDYSFDHDAGSPSTTSPFPYKRWLQTTLYVDGALVWGNEPCSSDGAP